MPWSDSPFGTIGPIEAAIFDMDGTLLDTEAAAQRATKAAVVALGFSITDEFCATLIGIPDLEGAEMLRAHLGPGFVVSTFQAFYEALRASFEDVVALKPGAIELVTSLSSLGFPLAIATSSDRLRAERVLSLTALRSMIPVVVTRNDVSRGKPYPDPFLLAASRLGVLPSRCLVVEDAVNGIRAAHAAGTLPVMVPDLVEPPADVRAMCVAVVPNLHALSRLLSPDAT